jgi:hypothetical protein
MDCDFSSTSCASKLGRGLQSHWPVCQKFQSVWKHGAIYSTDFVVLSACMSISLDMFPPSQTDVDIKNTCTECTADHPSEIEH